MKYNAFISYSHAADGKLAPALQIGLEKFAKPWYKLRNLNIFRDESSLSASPHLWKNIQEALENSEYLIYMASPTSAASKWVIKEVEYWLEHKSIETLLIVLTDGEINWDSATNSFANKDVDSLPDVLDNAFDEEPFYIDFRAVKSSEDVSLKNPLFKKEILKLAAHIHGKAPKDMAGTEVQEHRNMVRVRNSAILVLVALLGFSIYQTNEAKVALKNELEANKQKVQAEEAKALETELRLEAEIAKEKEAQMRIMADSMRYYAEEERIRALEAQNMALIQQKRAQDMEEMAKRQEMYSREAQNVADMYLAIEKGKLKFVKALLPYSVTPEYVNSMIENIEKADKELFHRYDSLEIIANTDKTISTIQFLNVRGELMKELKPSDFQ